MGAGYRSRSPTFSRRTSPASASACALTDQRGVARPQDGDGANGAQCDKGAVEKEAAGGAQPGKALARTAVDAPALSDQGQTTAVTTTITYVYDPLYRLTGATYSDGTEFAYEYDPVGNVLTRTQTIAAVESVTTYAYDAANQLETAQTSGESTVWYYTYDNNGSLTEITPNGATPANGARRYTYNAVRQLIRAEQRDGIT